MHQVKAHNVRAFEASKAFQGGISLDQILAACHWKSHNTFTQFYLNDVAWADSELFHLGLNLLCSYPVYAQGMRSLFHSCLGLPGIWNHYRTELFLSSYPQNRKRGGNNFGPLSMVWLLYQPGQSSFAYT